MYFFSSHSEVLIHSFYPIFPQPSLRVRKLSDAKPTIVSNADGSQRERALSPLPGEKESGKSPRGGSLSEAEPSLRQSTSDPNRPKTPRVFIILFIFLFSVLIVHAHKPSFKRTKQKTIMFLGIAL
jgi:hypothetical protein